LHTLPLGLSINQISTPRAFSKSVDKVEKDDLLR
jgi:hypothetical protein